MAPAEDTGSVECREEKGLLPVSREVQEKRCLVIIEWSFQQCLNGWSPASSDLHQDQSDGATSLNVDQSLLNVDAHMTELPFYRIATAAASEVEDVW